MSEAFGCGFYLGPDRQLRSNKTDYRVQSGNASITITLASGKQQNDKPAQQTPEAQGKSVMHSGLTGSSLRNG
ncbi:hypothetical protein [Luteimonas sp. SDU82]|uniref:hypothetical protein n=1 Tax=Luteimonas sp. SDU82 TaxID=3422592 RepID=UPI003EBB24DE